MSRSRVKPTEPAFYPVDASYSCLEAAIAAGKYDFATHAITAERFKLDGVITVSSKLLLYHPDRVVGSEDVLEVFNRKGQRPGTLPELCVFGQAYPDLQRRFPVVALGSTCVFAWNGKKMVPCLDEWGVGRKLDLEEWHGTWRSRCRFLAVAA